MRNVLVRLRANDEFLLVGCALPCSTLTAIRFTENKKGKIGIFWVLQCRRYKLASGLHKTNSSQSITYGSKELDEKVVHILAYAFFVVIVVSRISVGKADAGRLVNPQYIGGRGPRPWVVDLVEVLVL